VVTCRTFGDFDIGGGGFLVQGHDANLTSLDFFATISGEAWMEVSGYQYRNDNGPYSIEGQSSVHRGYGVPNQVALLVRGGQFTFYVNGQFALGYQDASLAGGQVELYASGDEVAFNDYAVYPLN
jgi:hypothetical protein